MKIQKIPLPRGAISQGCLGYIFVIALLWGGVQGIYTALKNRAPLEISAADFIKTRPSAEWVTLKEAQLNLVEAAHTQRFGKPTQIFIPVRPIGESLDTQVQILMSTKDKEILAAMEGINKAGEQMEKAVIGELARHADKLRMKRDISGLIKFGIQSDSRTRDKLHKLDINLAADFIILAEGEEPDLTKSIVMLSFGLIGVFIILRLAARAEAPVAQPPAPPPLPPRE
ncbi:MAG TPA: hypothetical protein DIT64_01850 [Verrucomicrobiales bacterium]|nr:hypothetical protein [Verrucomicrobiales bacterium]